MSLEILNFTKIRDNPALYAFDVYYEPTEQIYLNFTMQWIYPVGIVIRPSRVEGFSRKDLDFLIKVHELALKTLKCFHNRPGPNDFH